MQLLKFISNILKKLKKKHKRRIYFHSRGHISLPIFLPNTKNLKYEKTKQAIIHSRIRLMRIYPMPSYPRFARVVWSEEAHRLLKKKTNYFPALESQRRVSGRLSWGMPQHLKKGGRSAKRQLTQLLCILNLKYPNKNKREKLRLYSLALPPTLTHAVQYQIVFRHFSVLCFSLKQIVSACLLLFFLALCRFPSLSLSISLQPHFSLFTQKKKKKNSPMVSFSLPKKQTGIKHFEQVKKC